MRLLLISLMLALSLQADEFGIPSEKNYYYSGTLQVSNRYRTVDIDSGDIDKNFYQQDYSLSQTFVYNWDRVQLVTKYNIIKRDNFFYQNKMQNSYLNYFEALYLTYNIYGNHSIFAGLVPCTEGYLNIYGKKQEEIGEGLSLISGSIMDTVGYVYSKDGFKFKIGIVDCDFCGLDKGPYKDIIEKGMERQGIWTLTSYKEGKHSYEMDAFRLEAYSPSQGAKTMLDIALGYIYDDSESSGYSFYSQVALSNLKETEINKNGWATMLAMKVDSDLIPSTYSFEYGIEYSHTSKFFTTANISVTNNRYNNLYRGDRISLFSSLYITKDVGVSIAYTGCECSYTRGAEQINNVQRVDYKSSSFYTSIFSHF